MRKMRSMGAMILAGIMTCVLLAGLVAMLMPTEIRADSQGMPATMGAATNLPAIVNTATASNQTSVITLRQNRGLALQWTFNASGPSTTGRLWVYPSVDGTNASDTALTILSDTGTTGATAVATYQWSRASLEGYNSVMLSTVSNGSSSYILTNKGVVWQFPNN